MSITLSSINHFLGKIQILHTRAGQNWPQSKNVWTDSLGIHHTSCFVYAKMAAASIQVRI